MKDIVYRGGVVRFRIPATWKEEYEPEGGGHFYEDQEGSCTLHLNVLTFNAPKPTTVDEYLDQAKGRSGTVPELLPNGQILSRSEPEASRRTWQMARLILPNVLHVAVFVLECSDRPDEDVALVDRLVREAVVMDGKC